MAMHLSEEWVADYFEHYLGWAIRRNVRYKVRRNYSDLDLLAWPTPPTSYMRERAIWLTRDGPAVPCVVQVKWRKTFPFSLASATDEAYAWWAVGNDKMIGAAASRLAEPGQAWDLMLVAPASSIDLQGDARYDRAALTLELIKSDGWFGPDARDLRALHLVTFEELARAWASDTDADRRGWDETSFAFAVRLLGFAGDLDSDGLVEGQVESYLRSDVALDDEDIRRLSSGDWVTAEPTMQTYLERLAKAWELPFGKSGWSGPGHGTERGVEWKAWWHGRTRCPWWLGLRLREGRIVFEYYPMSGEAVLVEAIGQSEDDIRAAERAFVWQYLSGSE